MFHLQPESGGNTQQRSGTTGRSSPQRAWDRGIVYALAGQRHQQQRKSVVARGWGLTFNSSNENGRQTASTSTAVRSGTNQAHFGIVFSDCDSISGSRENPCNLTEFSILMWRQFGSISTCQATRDLFHWGQVGQSFQTSDYVPWRKTSLRSRPVNSNSVVIMSSTTFPWKSDLLARQFFDE